MIINIVTVKKWVVWKIAQGIFNNNKSDAEMLLSLNPRNDVDANFYVGINNCYKKKSGTLDVGLFFHLHENNLKHFFAHWKTLDFLIPMSTRYVDEISKVFPREKIEVIHPGEIPEGYDLKKPVLGIFQRGQYEGKGFFFMKKLLEWEGLKNFKFIIVGDWWQEVIELFKEKNVEVEYHLDNDYSIYKKLYDKIDYLFCPSLWEGGPMCLFEAYGKGIPIIGSKVGWFDKDFEIDYPFEPDDINECKDILNSIFNKRLNRRKRVEYINYEIYANKLCEVVKKMKGIE